MRGSHVYWRFSQFTGRLVSQSPTIQKRPRVFCRKAHHETPACQIQKPIDSFKHEHNEDRRTTEMSIESVGEEIREATKILETLEVKDKKQKQRKAQTEEEYLEQKRQFDEAGPQNNTDDWLYDSQKLSTLDCTKKLDRVHILHACEKAYFTGDYEKCLELIRIGERLYNVELDDSTANTELKNVFESSGRKTRKSTKVERHVVELLHIKEACLKKWGHRTSENKV